MCVLLVEDEPMLQEMISEYLTDGGFAVLTACNGTEAFDLIDNPPRPIKILMTDFNMPGLHDGCDVADHMKAANPHVHVFIVTGRPDLISATHGDNVEHTVIPKPFELKKLLALFQTLRG